MINKEARNRAREREHRQKLRNETLDTSIANNLSEVSFQLDPSGFLIIDSL